MIVKRDARHVHLRAKIGEVRTASFEEREHLVVPVVALVEGVIHAVGADHPELVLAEELSKVPHGWNGRPVLPDHPVISGDRISANDPRTLERQAFGKVFNAHMEGKKLVVEAWMDVDRAAKVEGAPRVLERIRAGETVEVSVGAFVVVEERSGKWRNGQTYQSIWREIVPDHLAFLPEGVTGACSVEMGCGAPRAAMFHDFGSEAWAGGGEMEDNRPWREKISGFLKTAAHLVFGESVSDGDLRAMLDQALRAAAPGYLGVDSVFPDEKKVVYAAQPGESLQLVRRGYEVLDNGEVRLSDDAEDVHPVTRFETANAQARSAAGCGCGGDGVGAPAKEEAVKKELVQKIIARKDGRFTTADATALEALSEERLKALAEEAEPKAPEPTPSPVVVTPEQRRAQLLAENPDIKDALEERAAQRATRTVELLTAIQATKQDAYAEAELKAMPVEQLEKTFKLLSVGKPKPAVDYAGAGGHRSESDSEAVPAPPSLVTAVRVARGVEKQS